MLRAVHAARKMRQPISDGDARGWRGVCSRQCRWAIAFAAGRAEAGKVSRRQFQLRIGRRLGRDRGGHGDVRRDVPGFLRPQGAEGTEEVWRVGKPEDYSDARRLRKVQAHARWQRRFWIVNLQPGENKLVALSTICTHLGCIPNWLSGDRNSSARATARVITSPASISKARRRGRWSGSPINQ